MAFAETDSKQSPISISCYFFFFFGIAASSLLRRLFSSCDDWGYSLAVVGGLLTVVASFVAEHGL